MLLCGFENFDNFFVRIDILERLFVQIINSNPDMPQLTTKQHAALQMLLRGADNNEIAMRFDVSPNTSKVYVRGVAKKLGVQTRAQIVVKLLDTFNELDDNSYRMLTGGLPKDWDRNYEEPDPFAPLYKIKRGSNDT